MYPVWNESPLLRALIPYITGILMAIHWDFATPWAFALIALLLIFYLFITLKSGSKKSIRINRLKGIIINLWIFLLGLGLVWLQQPVHQPHYFGRQLDKAGIIYGRISDPPVEKAKSVKIRLKILALGVNDSLWPVTGNALCYLAKDSNALQVRYGQTLLLENRLRPVDPPANPDEFNYKRYLSFNGIYHQGYFSAGSWKKVRKANAWSPRVIIDRLRNYFTGLLQTYLGNGPEFRVAAALLIGHRDLLYKDIIRSYSSTGAMHVLAVSGLHVGLVYFVFLSLFSKIPVLKQHKFVLQGLLILCIWTYAVLTGLSPSVVRATTMFTFIALGKLLKQPVNIYSTIAASAFFLLIIQPFLITQVGFLLSYAAVLGIVYLQPKLYKLLYFKNYLLDKIWALTCVSIAAQLATFPLGIFYFHQFPTYFFFSNLVVIPMAVVILYTGIALLALGGLPWAGFILGKTLWYEIHGLNTAIGLIRHLPAALITGLSITRPEVILTYLLIVTLVLFLIRNQVTMLRNTLLATFLLISSLSFRNIINRKVQQLIIYSINETTAVNWIVNKESIFIADSALLADEDRMLFHIRHHWWNLGIRHSLEVDKRIWDIPGASLRHPGAFAWKGHYMTVKDCSLYVLDDPLPAIQPGKPVPVDYLLVSGNIPVDTARLTKFFTFGHLVFDKSTPRKTRKMLRKWCLSHKMTFHDVSFKALCVPIE